MTYKNYSLEQLKNFLYDAMSAEATPQEIYDAIRGVVEDNYYTYKAQTGKAYELLALLNGNGKGHLTCDKDDPSPECKGAWNDFWEQSYLSGVTDTPEEAEELRKEIKKRQQYTEEEMNALWDATTSAKKGKVNKWILPVETDGPSGEYFVQFPDDLLEAADLKEGSQVYWIDQGDGSYLMKKVQPTYTSYADMIANGYTMTDDGFWIKEN